MSYEDKFEEWRANRKSQKPYRRFRDPLTGEPISFTEWVSLMAVNVLRRWTIILFYIGLSAAWWAHPAWFHDDAVYTKWMIVFSLLAVINESLIGIGMFSRSNRDSIVLRRVLKYLERGEERDREILALEGRILNLEQSISAEQRELEEAVEARGESADS